MFGVRSLEFTVEVMEKQVRFYWHLGMILSVTYKLLSERPFLFLNLFKGEFRFVKFVFQN